MENGVRFFLEGVTPGVTSFVLCGTEGRLQIHNDARDVELWRRPEGSSEPWLRTEPLILPAAAGSSVVLALEDLVACLDEGREPACNERHAARAMELCLALHASHRQGGRRVELPLENRALSVDTW